MTADIKQRLRRMEELISVTGAGGTLRVKKDDLIALVEFASVLAEQGEPEGEQVFIQRYGMFHASFGGIGGDAIRLDITREAWKSIGEPRVLAVSWKPAEEQD